MSSTTHTICQQYLTNNQLYRYLTIEDGLKGKEGTFGICSFWQSEVLEKVGQVDKAIQVFDTMLEHASPAGLFKKRLTLIANNSSAITQRLYTHRSYNTW